MDERPREEIWPHSAKDRHYGASRLSSNRARCACPRDTRITCSRPLRQHFATSKNIEHIKLRAHDEEKIPEYCAMTRHARAISNKRTAFPNAESKSCMLIGYCAPCVRHRIGCKTIKQTHKRINQSEFFICF